MKIIYERKISCFPTCGLCYDNVKMAPKEARYSNIECLNSKLV